MSNTDLIECIRNNCLFASLPEQVIASIANDLEILHYKLGETVIKKGDRGDGYYIVYKGKTRVVEDSGGGKPVTLAVLNSGDGFGERSLFLDQKVSATVRSAAKTVLLKLSSDAFKKIVESTPQIGEKIQAAQARQVEFNLLKTQNLISGLSSDQIDLLISKIKRINKQNHEIVFAEGDAPDAIYFIKQGQ